jgi:hypothetical protein
LVFSLLHSDVTQAVFISYHLRPLRSFLERHHLSDISDISPTILASASAIAIMHVQSRPAVSEQPFSSLEIFHNGSRAWEELLLTTGQMALFRPSPSLPMEVLGMIAKEADDEDIPAQRLVCPLWASVTATKFALLFHETAFEFSRAGMLNLLDLCKNPRLGPHIRTLIIFDDLKRKKVGKFHELYDQALVALSAYGQPLRFGVRWAPVASGERVDPKIASTRLINIMLKRVLPAAEAAGLDRNNLLLELPDASRTQVAGNDYRKIIWWISRVWNEHNIFKRPFNPDLTIRFASTPGMSANPTIIFTRSPNKVECRNLLAVHMAAFSGLIQSNYHREIHLVDCVVSDHFYDFNWGNFHNITMENVTLYEGVFAIDDHPLHRYAAGCAGTLLRNLTTRHPNLNRIKLENIREGDCHWLLDGPHTFDVTGNFEIARAIPHLLDGYRGWEIDYMCTDDEFVKTQLVQQWKGKGMGSGLLENPGMNLSFFLENFAMELLLT